LGLDLVNDIDISNW